MEYKLIFIAGTRPEILKIFPLIEYAIKKYPNSVEFVFSGQHENKKMSEIFFQEFKIQPDFIINGSSLEEKYINLIKYIKEKENSIFFVVGDTSTVLYSCIGYCHNSSFSTILSHIESGLHSLNPRSTEEKIRSIAERIADIRFAPSKLEKEILKIMNITKNVFVVGNPLYNALERYKINVSDKNFVLVTFHRYTNVKDVKILENFIEILRYLSEFYRIVYVTHPTTMDFLQKYGLLDTLKSIKNLELLEPLNYKEFLNLEASSSFIITDSGGVQEEALYFKKVTIILRPSSPRWHAILNKVHFLVNPAKDKKTIIRKLKRIIERMDQTKERIRKIKNFYYNKNCSKEIIEKSINKYPIIIKKKKNFDLSSIKFDYYKDRKKFLELFKL